jgi:glycosyltransferase involved in cell wall biosynthesis
MDPTISILTPVYNGARFIERCVEHVSSHNIPGLEHVVIDGASTDGTQDILDNLSRNHPHLRFISEKDKGQSDALNKGVRMAASDIIGILNADDFYEKGAIADGIAYLKRHPSVDFVTGDCVILWKDRAPYINRPKDLRLQSLILGWQFAEYPCNPSAYFYRKSVHDRIGPYDVDDHYAMDVSFILACAASIRMAYVPKHWGNFQCYPGTKTFEDKTNGTARVNAIREHWKAKLTPIQNLDASLIYHRKRLWRSLESMLTKRATFLS